MYNICSINIYIYYIKVHLSVDESSCSLAVSSALPFGSDSALS